MPLALLVLAFLFMSLELLGAVDEEGRLLNAKKWGPTHRSEAPLTAVSVRRSIACLSLVLCCLKGLCLPGGGGGGGDTGTSRDSAGQRGGRLLASYINAQLLISRAVNPGYVLQLPPPAHPRGPDSPSEKLEQHAAHGEPVSRAVVGRSLLQHLRSHVAMSSTGKRMHTWDRPAEETEATRREQQRGGRLLP